MRQLADPCDAGRQHPLQPPRRGLDEHRGSGDPAADVGEPHGGGVLAFEALGLRYQNPVMSEEEALEILKARPQGMRHPEDVWA